MSTEPSACWPFSRMATQVRPTARPLPLRVCAKAGLPSLPRIRMLARRAWKSVQLDVLVTSPYSPPLPRPGIHA
jgi:hypothetical protein